MIKFTTMFTSNEILTWTQFGVVNIILLTCLLGAAFFRRFMSRALVDLGVGSLLYGGMVCLGMRYLPRINFKDVGLDLFHLKKNLDSEYLLLMIWIMSLCVGLAAKWRLTQHLLQ